MTKLFTKEKETKRAIKAAVDQANKVYVVWGTHCASCGCTPKPDEWSSVWNCCIDCA